MNKTYINQTPTMTSVNFGMNNYAICKDIFKNNISEFKNVEITNNNKNIEIKKSKKVNIKLKYGLGDEALKQVLDKNNLSLDIIVKENTKNKELIIINLKLDDENKKLINNINIMLKENSTANIIINIISKNKGEFYNNSLIRTNLGKESKLKVILLNMINSESINLFAVDNKQDDNSKLEFGIVDFGGKESVTNYYTNLNGKNSKNNSYAIYLGNKKQSFDLNYIIEMYGKNSIADMDVQGALGGMARKNFKGTIDFKTGCKEAKGKEEEFCILLSNKAISKAMPILLCSEDDVEGEHASATGKLDEKAMFYIKSRGINKKEAEKLLVKAKLNKLIEEIDDEKIKENVIKTLESKI